MQYNSVAVSNGLSTPNVFINFSKSEVRDFNPITSCSCCGASDFDYPVIIGGTTPSEGVKVSLCKNCGHVSYNMIPSVNWLDHYYSKTWNADQRSTITPEEVEKISSDKAKTKRGLSYFMSLDLPKTSRILDFGSGIGHNAKAIELLGYQNVFGVEQSEYRAKLGSKVLDGKIYHGSIEKVEELVNEEGGFDLIIIRHVLEHLHSPLEVITRLGKCLSNEGKILIIVPNMLVEPSIIISLFLLHLHSFNSESLRQLILNAGLNAKIWKSSERELAVLAINGNSNLSSDWSEDLSIAAPSVQNISDFLKSPWATDNSKKELLYYFPRYQFPEVNTFAPVKPRVMRFFTKLLGYLEIKYPRLIKKKYVLSLMKWGKKIFRKNLIARNSIEVQFNKFRGGNGIIWVKSRKDGFPFLLK